MLQKIRDLFLGTSVKMVVRLSISVNWAVHVLLVIKKTSLITKK